MAGLSSPGYETKPTREGQICKGTATRTKQGANAHRCPDEAQEYLGEKFCVAEAYGSDCGSLPPDIFDDAGGNKLRDGLLRQRLDLGDEVCATING